MTKKFSLLLASLAVLAIAVPAAAGAHAVTSSAGKLAPVGTEITATGSDVTLTNAFVPITCATLTLKSELTKNNGTEFEGSGAAEKPAATDCTGYRSVVDVEEVHVTNIVAKVKGSTTTASFTEKVKVTSISSITCVFTGTNVPFTYTSGGNTIRFTEAPGITSTGGCGAATLDGEFAIEIGSTPVILD